MAWFALRPILHQQKYYVDLGKKTEVFWRKYNEKVQIDVQNNLVLFGDVLDGNPVSLGLYDIITWRIFQHPYQ